MPGEVLYSRYEDGAIPVHILRVGIRPKFAIERPDGPQVFPSARQLLISLTKHPEARHWTFSRYFKVGRYANLLMTGAVNQPALSTLEIFRPRIPSSGLIVTGGAVGIDLRRRSSEVAKLLFAGFGGKIKSAGYDPEDVLQEVFKGVLTRNAGTCPWDPNKSSFGHYVHMICSCVMSNYHRKQSRVRSLEQIGVFCYDSPSGQCDAASSDLLPAVEPVTELEVLDFLKFLKRSPRGRTTDGLMAARILPEVYRGLTRMEIAEKIGAPKAAVSRALTIIRATLRTWMAGTGN